MNKAEWVRIAIEKYELRLVRYVSGFVPENVAREIVQETFLKLWQQEMAAVSERLAEWLYAVCRNHAIDVLRRSSHHEKTAIDLSPARVKTPEEQVANKQEQQELMRMVSILPAEQQEVLRLKLQGELSYKEISAITGHSVSYVGVLINNAMTTLRERYGGKT